MITKLFAAAVPAMVFIAMSSQVHAGTTISDTRYWPSEVGPSSQDMIRPSDSDFGWVTPMYSDGHRHVGGPKSDD